MMYWISFISLQEYQEFTPSSRSGVYKKDEVNPYEWQKDILGNILDTNL